MKRTYSQFCGLARALDLVGERWTLLAVRELLTGPKRFSQLMKGLEGISTNLLTSRLKAMEEMELIKKKGRVYELTEFGWGLENVVFSLAQWGSQTMGGGPVAEEKMNIGWALLSLTRAYKGGMTAVIEVVVGEREFELTCRQDRLYVRERKAVGSDVSLLAEEVRPAIEVLKLGMPVEGRVSLRGDKGVFDSFRASIT